MLLKGSSEQKCYRLHPSPYLIDLENGPREELPEDEDRYTGSLPVFRAITYIINDARTGEFDAYPVI